MPRTPVIRTIRCENCGKEKRFTSKKYWRSDGRAPRFCSSECWYEYRLRNPKNGIGTCPVCQKTFVKKGQNLNQVCCSVPCREMWHLKKLMETRDRKCINCGVQLVPTKNWSLSHCRSHNYICDSCYAPLQKAYATKSRIKRRDHILQTHLRSNGKKWNHVEKRPYSKTCELCGRGPSYKTHAYHHWNDEAPEKGIWICSSCHMLVNMYDRMQKFPEMISKYLALRERIENEFRRRDTRRSL